MSSPNRIHLLPERDRMMAETYRQNADGSNNPTGKAEPQDAPKVHRGSPVGKVVRPPAEDAKPTGQSQASTKAKKRA